VLGCASSGPRGLRLCVPFTSREIRGNLGDWHEQLPSFGVE
jgi:hypothetical protein